MIEVFVKKTFFAVLFIFISQIAFYSQNSIFVKSTNNPIKKFFLSCWKYELSGVKDFETIENYCGISSAPARFMTLSIWNSDGRLIRLYEKISPEFAGYFDIFDYYDVSIDDGSWVNSLDFTEQNSFVVDRPVDFDSIEQGLKEIEDTRLIEVPSVIEQENENIAERIFTNNLQMLRLYMYGEEILTSLSMNDKKVLVSADKKRMIRKIYDESMKLVKKETWNISAGFNESFIAKTEDFLYGQENKLIQNTITTNTEKHILSYNSNGLVSSSKNYSKKESQGKSDWILQSSTNWTYDDKNRILIKQTETYEYEKERVINIQKARENYYYRIEDSSPDYYYFENDELKLKTEFSSSDDWITTMYFAEGFSVETYYKKSIKIKDYIYLNGILRRTKVYEMDS